MIRTREPFVFLIAAVGILVGPAGGWTQQSAESPDTTAALAPVLSELDSGQHVRLHLTGREPLDVAFVDATADSLFVGEDARTASVALSQIKRLGVARHPYWKGTRLGAFIGAFAGGVIGALSADWSPEVHQDGTTRPDAEAAAIVPLASVTVGVFGGGVAGGVAGLLTGAAITDWEQRYPPP